MQISDHTDLRSKMEQLSEVKMRVKALYDHPLFGVLCKNSDKLLLEYYTHFWGDAASSESITRNARFLRADHRNAGCKPYQCEVKGAKTCYVRSLTAQARNELEQEAYRQSFGRGNL